MSLPWQFPEHPFQLDTFYNSLNSNDQDALDSAAGGNFLDKMPQEGLAIIESKSKVRYSRSRANDSRSCGNGAHIGYNCPPKVPIISNPEQCNQTINELPQTLPSVHPTCNYEDENSFTYDSKPNSFNDSPSVLTHPPQLQFETYLCELCGNNAHYGYDCPPQFPLVYEQEPCYNQNFNDNYFPQNSQSSSQQYLCCENCGGPHETFQCQPMNEDYYEQNSCYDPNSFSFDQHQPPQFPVNYPSQETSREILQEDLMKAIQAFLKEYDHIPPNEKCMALLLAEERFFKIKQTMREEHNQPEKKKPTVQSSNPYWNSSMIDDEEARDNFLKDVCTFLRKFSRIPFGVTPKVILIAWERFGEIKDALMDKQYRQEDIQKLMRKLLKDVRNISEELSEYINCPSWNRPLFYFDDDNDEYTVIWRKPKEITPDLPIEESDNSLNMRDEHLDTIPATELDEVIKSSVENLVPIPSEFEGMSDDMCDVPTCDNNRIDPILEEFAGELTHIAPISPEFVEAGFDPNDDTSSNDDSFENIEYVDASPSYIEYDSFEEVNDVEQEEKEFDLEDIFQIQDVILREKLLNVHRLISNIESLKVNPTLDQVFESPSTFPIPVVDSDSSVTSLSFSNNSLPEFESFSDHTEETRSGSTTTHANYSLSEYESFHFDDQSFPRPPPKPPDVEICSNFESDSTVINNLDVLNNDEPFDQGGGENVVFLNDEEDDSFTFTIRTFLPFVTYPEVTLLSCSTGSEDTIFDPGISI
ncbi:hypothetical protein Tco_0692177 [Tanacetum coccineum]